MGEGEEGMKEGIKKKRICTTCTHEYMYNQCTSTCMYMYMEGFKVSPYMYMCNVHVHFSTYVRIKLKDG